MGGPRAALAATLTVAALAGCAGARIEGGVFHSPAGYRLTLPGPDWVPASDGRADLELRHRGAPAGMLANAACDAGVARRSMAVLTRQVLVGLRERVVVSRADVTLAGRPAAHTVVEGRMAPAGERVRVEMYLVKDAGCVYDFLYVAPPGDFERWQADFHRFVESFVRE